MLEQYVDDWASSLDTHWMEKKQLTGQSVLDNRFLC